MKKLLIAALLLAGTQGVFAQTEKGTWLLGGTAGFNSSKEKNSDAVSTFNISPNVGYFFGNDLAVGAAVDFETVSDSYTSIGFSPFVRYYFLPIGENAKLFGNGSIGFGSYKPEGFDSQGYFNWGIQAGPAFFLNPSIALEATVGYSSLKPKDSDAIGNFGVNVGFQIHFGGKK